MIAAAIVVGAGGCSRPESPRTDAIVLVSVDTMRGDRFGAGGDAAARTPQLDRLARCGTQCATAVSPAPVTLPAHASLLTGLLPPAHGARDNGSFRVRDDVPLLAENMRRAGRATMACSAAFPLASRFGLARGFDVYADSLGVRASGESFAERPARSVTRDALARIDAAGTDRPLFLWMHFFDPHAPYEPPPPWSAACGGDGYRGEIAFTDRELGLALRALRDRYHPLRVCVTADHGESLGEHGEDTHGVFVYESTTRVPLVFCGPGADARLVKRPVGLTEVAGALEEWNRDARLELPAERSPGTAGLYSETLYPELRHGWSRLRALRTERWKVIRAPRPEVYDMIADPGETTNLHGSPAAAAGEQLAAALEDPRWDADDRPEEIDPETEAALLSLGYAGTVAPDARPAEALPDPKDRIRLERILSRAGGALESGRLAAARSALGSALAVDPGNKEANLLRARVEAAAGQIPLAEEVFAYCLELEPASLDAVVYYELGRVQLHAGRPADARASFAAAVERDPLNVDARFNLGVAESRQ
ncbi:MAG TPA: sulfatase-like hydrolase/transferase, partial [bacterium]|nr:sulfatase-like hydrolase/transferase [bacterium]